MDVELQLQRQVGHMERLINVTASMEELGNPKALQSRHVESLKQTVLTFAIRTGAVKPLRQDYILGNL